ncbi:hypothetical protein F0562_019906 [Nyssa sinensis]|uniref:Phospholipase n=1 Tax=Nyssa sinensis TaxID=561372 RepID=A0A5J5BQF3_9ASTE|nr:hypothetical protein F0562_019906 [Nyssa sinensis]
MSLEQLIAGGASHYVPIQSDSLPPEMPSSHSFWYFPEPARIFEELPKATIVSVSRPDASDISPLLLSYVIELQYKQFKWRLLKKASQVIYLHFALKKRAIIEELHEKQEQVKELLQNIGIGDQTAVVHDDDEPDDGAVPIHNEDALGWQQTISDKAKVAMQGYLNHFLGNMDIVNSREVCRFLEVSKLSFLQEYGPKMKEDYVTVNHLAKISRHDTDARCCACCWFGFCNIHWQKVWAVLKPGFLALLEDPFDTKLLDIIIFDVLPASNKDGKSRVSLAEEIKERNPLRYSFKVSCGNRSMKLRTTSNAKVREWVSVINDASLRPPEGWCHPHRFGSFAPPRGLIEDGSQAQWFIDGQAAFEAIASSIENAKSEIYITGWWLCPELYLRRPFHNHGSSRLDALLEAKAKQGVQIYILLYKEVSIALKINSLYSKKRLLNIHENVRVLRSPDHFSAGVYLWSHHEKLVIVDYQICFIGGLDLCFGRYDTNEHKVGDYPPFIWPGKDYYNPRESEPNSWEDTMKDELEREKYPRMPWHDVHCALWGPPCRDVARHFVQRWNHAKRNKAPNEQTLPLLMPHHHMVIPHYMGRSREREIENENSGKADGLDASNVDNKLNGLRMNQYQYHLDQPSKVGQSLSFSFQKSTIEPVIPDMQMKGFVDDLDSMDLQSEMTLDAVAQSDMQISDDWWETQEQRYQGVSADETAQVGPRTPCHCQVIRSVSHWSAGTSQTEDSIHRAYCSLIEKAEHLVYIENQFFISGLSGDEIIQNRVLEALYRRIMQAHKEQKCFRVIIVIPLLPGFQGGLDDSGHMVDFLMVVLWLRSQVYVHSKVMIIDDRAVLVGSSNINDRSLLGSRDSEIGVLIEDTDFLESSMNGEPWKAGKFAFSLRLSLWSEHLGLHAVERSRIKDPVSDSTYKDLWLATAKTNTMIYQDVFSCVPNDLIHSRSALRQSMGQWKEKLGNTTIDLGVAPEKVECYQDGEITRTDPMEKLKSVRGYLVSFPLEFVCQEDLRPVFSEGEFYASPQVFH